jgi:hypothetical protein
MSENQNAHDIRDPNLPDTFQKIQNAVDHPLDVANSGKNSVPHVGFTAEAARAVERGRAAMRENEAARKGVATFPPTRLLGKAHKP